MSFARFGKDFFLFLTVPLGIAELKGVMILTFTSQLEWHKNTLQVSVNNVTHQLEQDCNINSTLVLLVPEDFPYPRFGNVLQTSELSRFFVLGAPNGAEKMIPISHSQSSLKPTKISSGLRE